MTLQSSLQISITLLLAFWISIPAGRYLGRVFMDRETALDRIFDPIDNFIYRLTSRRLTSLPMDWKAYTLNMLATNLVMLLIIFFILIFQNYLPLNPLHMPGVEPMLAF